MEKKFKNINTMINAVNHDRLMDIVNNEKLVGMRINKATVLEVAISHLYEDIKKNNKSFEQYALEHLGSINSNNAGVDAL